MSETLDTLREIVLDRASSTTDPVQNLRTGLWLTAEIEPVDPILAQTEFGEDAREMVILHVSDFIQAAGVNAQDQMQFRLLGRLVTYKVVKRRDNAANTQVDFWAMQVVGGKDA